MDSEIFRPEENITIILSDFLKNMAQKFHIVSPA